MERSSAGSRAEDGSGVWLLALLLGASIEPVLVKLGYRAAASPWQLLALKSVVAALAILPLTRVRTWPGGAGLLRIARVGLLLLATNALTLLALTRLPAVTLLTVVATTPAAVGLVAQARGRMRAGPLFWAALVASVVGMALTLDLLGHGARIDLAGLAAAFAAVGTSTVYRSAMEDVTSAFGPPVVSFWMFVVNAVVSLTLVLPLAGLPPRGALPVGVVIGIAAAVANVAFLVAIHRLGATRVSVFTLLQRPFVMVLAAIVLGEPLGAVQVVGIALVLAGVHVAQREARAARTS